MKCGIIRTCKISGETRLNNDFLVFDHVTKRFGALTAVDDVSLSITKGEFFSLLGPSGCGKTTLLRMLGGFEKPDSGRIYLEGKDITDLPPNQRRIHTVFQNYALFPTMTIWDNIAFSLKLAKLPKGEIEEIRGVDVSANIKTLMDLQLIRLVGKSELPGHPFLYGTTPLFLEHFGLASLQQLNELDPTLQRSNPREKAAAYKKPVAEKTELETAAEERQAAEETKAAEEKVPEAVPQEKPAEDVPEQQELLPAEEKAGDDDDDFFIDDTPDEFDDEDDVDEDDEEDEDDEDADEDDDADDSDESDGV